MKTTFKLLFACALVLSVVTGNIFLFVSSVVGLSMAYADRATFSRLALFTLVPAILRDNGVGNEIPPFTRAQKFMFDFLRAKANEVTLEAYLSGAIFFDPINYYVRYVIAGGTGGRQQVLGANTVQIVGASNFYLAGLLPQYYNFCFDRIQVNYGTVAAAAAAVQSISGWTNVRSSMPAALGNGELIVQLNKNIIVQSGICDFTSEAAITGGNSLGFAGGALEVPRILQENQTITADIDMAVNQVFPNTANTTYGVEVLFKGAQLRLR